MSWLDLIDDDSLDRFVRGGGGGGGDIHTGNNTNNELLNGISSAGGVIALVDVTSPPPVVDTDILFDDDDDDDDYDEGSSYGSITILPSATSSLTAGVPQVAQRQRQEQLLPQASATDVSIATLESSEDSFALEEEESTSTSLSLSLHPESLESSLMTEFTGTTPMISSVSSEERSESSDDDSTTTSMDSCGSPPDSRTDSSSGGLAISAFSETEQIYGTATTTPTPPPTTTTTTNSSTNLSSRTEDQLKRWYSHFQTEQDWDDFRDAAYEMLKAIDCPLEDRDDLIAQLIAAEEDLFWEKSKSKCPAATGAVVAAVQEPKTWLLEVAAVVATVAIAGVAVVRILKGR
jgi:hypothetical protein